MQPSLHLDQIVRQVVSTMYIDICNKTRYNNGDGHVERVQLPLTTSEIFELEAKLGLSEEPDEFGQIQSDYMILSWDISDVTDEYTLDELFDDLDVSQYDIDDCNDISDRLDEVYQDCGFDTYLAVVEAGRADRTVDSFMEIDFDDYVLYRDIVNDEQLGRYMYDEYGMEEWMESFLDFEAIGRDYLDDYDVEEHLRNEGYNLNDPEDVERCLDDYVVASIDAITPLDCVGFGSYEDYGKEVYEMGSVDPEQYLDFEDIGEYFYYDGDFTSYGWLRHY